MLTSALSSGQSAIASEPSSIDSVSRYGEATEPESRWSRPITIGALISPLRDELVEAQPEPAALAVAEPADPRRQPLEGDALAAPSGSSAPSASSSGNSSSTARSVAAMSAGSPGERRPAERALALAEEGPDVGGDEAGVVEGALEAAELGLARGGCCRSRRPPTPASLNPTIAKQCAAAEARARSMYSVGVALAQLVGLREREPRRDVADQRVVGRRLVGDDVRLEAAAQQLGHDLGRVARTARRSARGARPSPRCSDRSRRPGRRPARRGSASPAGGRMRSGSTSTQSATPSFIVTASGCAPPMPPRPAVSVIVPARLPPKRRRAISAKHS